MRVAFVLSSLQAGGAERVVALISREAVAQGWQVTVVSFDRPEQPIYHSFAPEVRFRRLSLPSGASGLGAIRQLARRAAALRGLLGEFDVVITFLTKINILALLSSLGMRVPVIASERNNPRRQPMNHVWRLAMGFAYRRAAAIVVQTESSMACVPKSVRRRAVVIPNPVAPAPPVVRREGLVAVGRLTPQKGFDLLIDAVALLDLPREWRLTLWGEGPERDMLAARIKDRQLDRRITLAGVSDQPGSWLASGDIFLLSSRYEGWPNALAEAMAAGFAVVAFDCDFGPADLIRHGENGLLVPSEDAAALAAAIDRLVGDPDLRARLGAAAVASMARFGVETIARTWLALAASVAPGRGARVAAISADFAKPAN